MLELTKEKLKEIKDAIDDLLKRKVSSDLYITLELASWDDSIVLFEVYEYHFKESYHQFIFSGRLTTQDKNYPCSFNRWNALGRLHDFTFLTPYEVQKAKKIVKNYLEELLH